MGSSVDCAGGCFVSNAFFPWIADARQLPRAPSAISGLSASFLRGASAFRFRPQVGWALEEAWSALAVCASDWGVARGRRQGWPLRSVVAEADQASSDQGPNPSEVLASTGSRFSSAKEIAKRDIKLTLRSRTLFALARLPRVPEGASACVGLRPEFWL